MDTNLTKSKIIVLFSIIFILLATWTVTLFFNVQRNHELITMVMAAPLTGEELWKEQYRPLSNAEYDALIARVHEEKIENNSILLITYKSNIILDVIWKKDDVFNIWKPSTKEVKRLILKHAIELQHIDFDNGKRIYILRDYGVVKRKHQGIVAMQFNNKIIQSNHGDIRKSLSMGGGGRGAVISPYY